MLHMKTVIEASTQLQSSGQTSQNVLDVSLLNTLTSWWVQWGVLISETSEIFWEVCPEDWSWEVTYMVCINENRSGVETQLWKCREENSTEESPAGPLKLNWSWIARKVPTCTSPEAQSCGPYPAEMTDG